jgi:glycosyltransferase involved in cell wall biosynthesis
MSNADVLVLTSLYEGMSHTLIEAMAAGLPCIASNRGGNGEVINSGKNGILIEPQNVQALAASLRQLESDEDLRQRISKEARDRIIHFSMDRTVQEFINLLMHPT